MVHSVVHLLLLLLTSIILSDGAEFYDKTTFEAHFSSNSTMVKLINEHVRKYQDRSKPASVDFNCLLLKSASTPKSVHLLRPGDISVVAAMGDSITAGTGIRADTILGLLLEFRGLSWSIGGDSTLADIITLPNILKKYNPDLKGYSLKLGSQESINAHLNVAEPGAKASDLIEQTHLLIQRLQDEPRVDLDNDWKVITIFIGGNDLCDFCHFRNKESSPSYIHYIQEALDILHKKVPRAFVNLVEVIDVTMVEELNAGVVCSALHLWKCKCAAFPRNFFAGKELKAATRQYQNFVKELVESGRYNKKDDFTVVVQPFTRHTKPPTFQGEPDLSFFAPDCFHFSEKGHATAALALWNNMVEPVGLKQKHWVPGGKLKCPTNERPYLYTGKNSHQEFYQVNYVQENLLAVVGEESAIDSSHGSSTVFILVTLMISTIATILGVLLWKRHKKSQSHTVDSSSFLLSQQTPTTVIYSSL